ncbi:hypothetical protein [Pseudomonas sp. OV546]|uniref:hypothetical protein n=1 Tax=Pseudomonas sp. OV546 TaxID=1881063 RepID=UPI0008E2D176|nr:hypothetical protein [Pseudomonas sp. OV546]SFU80810.1 hypothetical protein SAMN05428951_104398 [Pseudomonas sp. OV546]
MEHVERSISTDYFVELIGEELLSFIEKKAPTKVWSRILKAMDHAEKARLLDNIDNEMGAIRLIAAEEELVVAIFEWLKLNESKMPEHRDLVRSYKNHQAKLMFYPVLSLMYHTVSPMIQGGLALEGLEHYQMKVTAKISSDTVIFHICDLDGKEMLPLNPLSIFLSLDDKSNEEVIDSLYQQLVSQVEHTHNFSLKVFVTQRADYRNQLLYANDGGFITGIETVSHILEEGFNSTFKELLWTIAILLGNDPISPKFGLISQFISVYRRVLLETKVIRHREEASSSAV